MIQSAQVDRFVHARLPRPEQMPTLLFDAPQLQFPDRLNLVEELLDNALSEAGALGRRCAPPA